MMIQFPLQGIDPYVVECFKIETSVTVNDEETPMVYILDIPRLVADCLNIYVTRGELTDLHIREVMWEAINHVLYSGGFSFTNIDETSFIKFKDLVRMYVKATERFMHVYRDSDYRYTVKSLDGSLLICELEYI